MEVAYTNPLIDSFCIVSGDSDYTPLVGRLKSMGKFMCWASRVRRRPRGIFINACNGICVSGIRGGAAAQEEQAQQRAPERR